MGRESLEGGEEPLAGEGDISGFDLGGVAFGESVGDGVGRELVGGKSEPEAFKVFIQEMDAVDLHLTAVVSRFAEKREQNKSPSHSKDREALKNSKESWDA